MNQFSYTEDIRTIYIEYRPSDLQSKNDGNQEPVLQVRLPRFKSKLQNLTAAKPLPRYLTSLRLRM